MAETEAQEGRKGLEQEKWFQLRHLWEIGDSTLAELSNKFGVRVDTIQKRLKKEGSVKGSRAHEAIKNASEASEEELARQAVEVVKRIHETKNNHYVWNEAIGKMVMAELVEAKQLKQSVSMKDANLGALAKAAKTLEIIRKERYALLGLDKEDGDPEDMDELIISELDDEMIKRMQAEMRGMEFDTLDGLDDLTRDNDNDTVIETEDDDMVEEN